MLLLESFLVVSLSVLVVVMVRRCFKLCVGMLALLLLLPLVVFLVCGAKCFKLCVEC